VPEVSERILQVESSREALGAKESGGMPTQHVALLGDSIFDNRSYTGGEPDVVTHLRAMLQAGWRASLYAIDGATTKDFGPQLLRVPADASHIVVSLGGNDALENSDVLALPVRSTTEALGLFAHRVARFERAYRAALDRAFSLGRDTTICTIYEGNLEPDQASLARIGLMLFNDVILRVAFERRISVIDLRLICTEPTDYANPIEPSGTGGRKIATAIARSLGALDPKIGTEAKYSRVFIE